MIQYSSTHPLFSKLKLSVFGAQNQLDAVATVLAAIEAGVSREEAESAIQAYRGSARRQEFRGEVAGRLLYDDYGHHPDEITVTVRSFKEHFPNRRILLVFESHTYSRTEALLAEFAIAIGSADLSFLMPIFESAREKGQKHVITPELFVAKVRKYNPACQSVTWDNATKVIAKASKPGDLILTMGAGFVYKLHPQLTKILASL